MRLWTPGEGEAGGTEIRGVVEHVSSGLRASFRGTEELLAFLATTRSQGREPRNRARRGKE